MILSNIERAAAFDKTAQAIMGAGLDRVMRQYRNNIIFDKSGCWLLKSKPMRDGYTRLQLSNASNGTRICSKGHRILWLLSGLELTDGMVLDHKCRNRGCVNPFHLGEVTMKENVLCGISPSAVNSKKTHCKNGHEFSKHARIMPGARICRICVKMAMRRHRARRRLHGGGQLIHPI